MTEPFKATHIITHNGRSIPVQLVDGACYTRAEWESDSTADWEFSTTLLFQGQSPQGDWFFEPMRPAQKFRDTDEAAAFIASADSRETSKRIMQAIAFFARNLSEAEELWNGDGFGRICHSIDLWEYVTCNGRLKPTEFCWGAAGHNWWPAMMKTYTIAYVNDLLLAVVPDDQDVHAAVLKEIETANLGPIEEYKVESGLILTDDRPAPEEGKIIFASPGGSCGLITDEHDNRFGYAVRPLA